MAKSRINGMLNEWFIRFHTQLKAYSLGSSWYIYSMFAFQLNFQIEYSFMYPSLYIFLLSDGLIELINQN